MAERIDLEDMASYVPEGELRVYIGCSLTSDDSTGLRDCLLEQVEVVFRESGFLVHNPSSHTKPRSPHHAHEVTAFDHLQAMRCDLIFFIRVQPSLGMGIEAQIAADMLIPWADAKVSEDSFKLTPLVVGLPNPSAGIRLYFDVDKVDEFSTRLRQRLQDKRLRTLLRDVRRAKAVAGEVIRRVGIGRLIRRQRLLLNMSAVELAELVDLEPWWIRTIESDPGLGDCLTFMQLMRLVDATRLHFAADPPRSGRLGFPRLEPIDSFSSGLFQAAEEFMDYSLRPRFGGEPPPDNDEQMLAHWRAWLSESKGLELPPRPERLPTRAAELTAFLAVPLSNVRNGEKDKLDRVVAAVRRAFEQIKGVSLDIMEPDYQRTNREDRGTEIYLATLRRLSQCDFAVALAEPPATGVGIITRLFANATVPCLPMAEKDNPVSRMFQGMYCRWLDEMIDYGSTDEVSGRVEEALGKHMASLCESAVRKRTVRDRIVLAAVTNAVDRFRIPRRLGFEEAIRHVKTVPFIRAEWLDALARDAAVLPTVTLLQFVHIASQLGWDIGLSSSGVPCLIPQHYTPDEAEDRLLEGWHVEVAEESLGNLLAARDVANQRLSSPVDDETLFNEWEEYHRDLATRAPGDLEKDQPVRAKHEWLEVLLKSRPSAFGATHNPTSQMLLPGMGEYVADDADEADQTTSPLRDAALFLLRIAEHGLPPCVIARAVDDSPGNVERALAGEFEAGAVRSIDGIWAAAKERDGQRPINATHLLHRATESLLTALECDKDATFSRGLLRNAFLLGSAGKPLPATLSARLYVLKGDHGKALHLVGDRIREIRDNESKEYVELLIILGRAVSNVEEAVHHLDEAIDVCERNSSRSDDHDSVWLELYARARLARGMLSKGARQGDPRPHLSKAAKSWDVVGNVLGRSVAEWHFVLSEDKNQALKKHQARLERESPLIRVEAVHLYKAQVASTTQPALARREELTYVQCEQFIEAAKSKLFRKPATE